MNIKEIIERKRDGGILSSQEIDYFIKGYMNGEIKDYHVSALLMAILFRSMDENETRDLTMSMIKSGEIIDLSSINGVKVDKHSTGGVGDKTTLIVAPIVASCGVKVAKMSGRGLGHTGGTIDKLESIPGFRTKIDNSDFIELVKKSNISLIYGNSNLVPADKKLYSLRDVTGTVESIPLIASSIMSKKIASGCDKIVLDVKCGKGAFMKSLNEAILLSHAMVKIGNDLGKRTTAIISNMDTPIGKNIGNSLEVIESIEVLKGSGDKDLKEISFNLAIEMLHLGLDKDIFECEKMVNESISSGSALEKFRELIINQGGNPSVIDDYGVFGKSKYSYQYISQKEGYVYKIDSELIGKISCILGAGRVNIDDKIDYNSGVILNKKIGDYVNKKEMIMTLYSNNEEKIQEVIAMLEDSVIIISSKPKIKPLILGIIDNDRTQIY